LGVKKVLQSVGNNKNYKWSKSKIEEAHEYERENA